MGDPSGVSTLPRMLPASIDSPPRDEETPEFAGVLRPCAKAAPASASANMVAAMNFRLRIPNRRLQTS
jgi:hypothetical protein